jgi:hypothetical protein
MQQLGARLLFYWLDLPTPKTAQIVENLAGSAAYKEKLAACQAKVNEFLLALYRQHARKGNDRPFGVDWSRDDDRAALAHVARIALLAARARAVVSMWKTDAGELNFQPPNIEQPHRLATLLYNLARGHALIHGRVRITADDIALIIRVALDSMPIERRRILRVMIAAGGCRSSRQIAAALECSRPTAIHLMRELEILKLVTEGGDNTMQLIELRKEFQWLRAPKVRALLGIPPDGDADNRDADEDDADDDE